MWFELMKLCCPHHASLGGSHRSVAVRGHPCFSLPAVPEFFSILKTKMSDAKPVMLSGKIKGGGKAKAAAKPKADVKAKAKAAKADAKAKAKKDPKKESKKQKTKATPLPAQRRTARRIPPPLPVQRSSAQL